MAQFINILSRPYKTAMEEFGFFGSCPDGKMARKVRYREQQVRRIVTKTGYLSWYLR